MIRFDVKPSSKSNRLNILTLKEDTVIVVINFEMQTRDPTGNGSSIKSTVISIH
jgi:hypothetical protein